MRIYLSGAISNDPNFIQKFMNADKTLHSRGYQVVNPAELYRVLPQDITYEEIMQIDLQLMDLCEALVQLPGWEKSLGCNREYGYALAKDMIILQYSDLVNREGEK